MCSSRCRLGCTVYTRSMVPLLKAVFSPQPLNLLAPSTVCSSFRATVHFCIIRRKLSKWFLVYSQLRFDQYILYTAWSFFFLISSLYSLEITAVIMILSIRLLFFYSQTSISSTLSLWCYQHLCLVSHVRCLKFRLNLSWVCPPLYLSYRRNNIT